MHSRGHKTTVFVMWHSEISEFFYSWRAIVQWRLAEWGAYQQKHIQRGRLLEEEP